MKILLLDIETAPHLAYVWSLWDEAVTLDRLLESGTVLSWAAKWYGEDVVYFDSVNDSSKKKMLKEIYKLLNEADAVVTYNGDRFDLPYLNRSFLELGLTPPSPYKSIDLFKTVKRKFKFPSNKLQYVAQQLGVGSKVKHDGFELWVNCIKGNQDSWAKMEEYNIGDVILLEGVYNKLLPWVTGHANHSLFSEDAFVCPNCGSTHLQKRGFSYTLASKFQRYVCKSCGHWCKDNKILNKSYYKTTSIV